MADDVGKAPAPTEPAPLAAIPEHLVPRVEWYRANLRDAHGFMRSVNMEGCASCAGVRRCAECAAAVRRVVDEQQHELALKRWKKHLEKQAAAAAPKG